jgi:hypothetical protein
MPEAQLPQVIPSTVIFIFPWSFSMREQIYIVYSAL